MGFNGVSAASFGISLSSVGVFIVAKKYVDFSVVKVTYKQLIAALLMFGFAYFTSSFVTSFIYMIVMSVLSVGFYVLVIFILARDELIKNFRFVTQAIRSKH